ncbi:hypothetical protein C7374_11467 [Falsochrobactrum ovis]|uniref:Uncharacterized protein n=2 Tax=Falsochrobactrum ovis TaxID=1293442 RepID=A0A364JTA2_9HYPH|nr:hypothetical protein C7374_11467 [Falsochrobactrum ovis]
MMKKIAILATFALLSTGAVAADDKRLERAMDAIRAADEAAIVMIYGLTDCEKAQSPMSSDLWSIYRDQTISAIQKIYKDKSKAIVRFDDIYQNASKSPNDASNGEACIYMLDKFKYELDVAIARMQESFK